MKMEAQAKKWFPYKKKSVFTLCFHFYIFNGTLGTKSRNLTKKLVPLSKRQEEYYRLHLDKFSHGMTDEETMNRLKISIIIISVCKLTCSFIKVNIGRIELTKIFWCCHMEILTSETEKYKVNIRIYVQRRI